MDFLVTQYLDDCDDVELWISVEVSDEERELLRDCYRDGCDIEGYEGLEDLCDRIVVAIQDEIDYDDDSCVIQIPDEIVEEVDSEDNNDESIEWEDYCGYPFAMEVVNGEIISLTPEFQEKIKDRILEKFQITEEELIAYLLRTQHSEAYNERFALLGNCENEVLFEILGFDDSEQTFLQEGIGFLKSRNGWQAKRILEKIGFCTEENIDYGSHGHGSDGVVFISG